MNVVQTPRLPANSTLNPFTAKPRPECPVYTTNGETRHEPGPSNRSAAMSIMTLLT